MAIESLAAGERIANRYKTISKLGEGAMGLVWLVEDASTGQQVALKLVTGELTEQAVLAFKQEFRLMTLLDHPNCCKVYDYGTLSDGRPFYTMEIVPGYGIDEMLPMPLERLPDLLAQLLRALGHVHQQGFVHRDIKSPNVRVRPDGTLKLMDYGLMEYAGRSELPISGTLGYLAPEVIKRGPVDQRADLYSAGALAFEMATGQLPFPRATRVEILRAHTSEAPPQIARVRPEIDRPLADVIARLLAKEPTERFQSADEVLTALGFASEVSQNRNLLAAPLLGREDESMRLLDLAEFLSPDIPGQAVIVEGPVGVGKSRLIKEFRASVALSGTHPVGYGAAREHAPPYTPFREALRGLVPAMREHVPDAFTLHAPVLATLLPELDVTPAPELDSPNKEKIRLQGAVTELLRSLAVSAPYLLLLEDWHWADSLSADLLDYLLRNLADLPVLAVVTARELPASARWADTAERLELNSLSPLSIRRMVTAMLGTDDVSPRFLDAVAEVANGNPFYVERCLEHMVAIGALVRVDGRWNTEEIALDTAVLPGDMQALMVRKLAELPEDAIAVARVAAVIGRAFELQLAKKLTGLKDEPLLDALDALLRQQILIQTDTKAYAFAHGIFRDMVYESFSPAQRVRMHEQVADALVAEVPKGQLRQAPFELVTAIADHYILGCVPDKIVAYALEAGRRSAALFAATDAETYLGNALTMLKSDNSPRWQKPKLLALRLLADTRRLTGAIEGARDLYLEAVPLAQQIGAQDYLSRMLTSLADCYVSLENMQEALACCHRSLEISLGNDNKASAARCYLTSCVVQFMQGNLQGSIQDTEQALALAREVEDKGSVAEALAFLGHLYVAAVANRSAEGITYLTEAIGILQELGNKVGLANAYNLLGAAQYRQGDFAPALESFSANQRLCFELGLKEEEAFALLNLSISDYELGRFASGVEHAHAAKEIALKMGYGVVHALAIAFLSAGKAYLGRLNEANSLMNEAVSLFKESANRYIESRVLEHRVALLLYMGHLKEAREVGEHLLSLLAETGNTEPEAHVNAMLGEIVARQGDLDGAEPYLERALKDAQEADTKGVLVQIHKVRAYVALQRDKFDDARQIAREALVMSYRAGTKYQTAELQGVLGEIDLATGEGTPGPFFAQMTKLAEEMGAVLVQSLGLFGQAASHPYDETAIKYAARAQQLVHAMVVGLDPAAVQSFWGMKERKRVMNGNYIEFSIKKATKQQGTGPLRPGTGPLMNLKFNHGMM